MNAVEKQLGLAFLAARKGEVALRKAIRADLSRVDGPLWYSRIPEELVTEWERRHDVETRSDGPVRGQELLDYATISELAALVKRFWDVFRPRFGERELVQNRLTEFRQLRNALMHGVNLTEGECQRLSELVEILLTQCAADVKFGLDTLATQTTAVEKPRTESRYGLDENQQALLRVITSAMEQMSGLLAGERTATIEYLQKNLPLCSPDVLARVREKFKTLPGTDRLINKLLFDLPPPRPERPKNKWKVRDWLKWADRSYMPYKRWMIRHNKADDEIDEMDLSYEDWLYRTYPGLLLKNQDSLVVSTYKSVRQHLDSGTRVLWLITDNLCGLWLPEFVTALEGAGLQIRLGRRMLAMLPSTTAVSRRAMLAGRLPRDSDKFANDEVACEQLWVELGKSDVSFCNSIQEVESVLGSNVELIILLFNRLDSLAHESNQPGFDREEEMTAVMGRLAAKVGNVVRKMKQIGPAKLIVSTDHGSIWPNPNGQTIAVPPSAAVDEDFKKHRRFSSVRDVSGLNNVDWYILDAEDYGLPVTYAIARGQRYIGARPRAFTHGGLSPEETVVTFLVGESEEREPLELVLTQATPPLRLGRPGALAVLVRNPFDVFVEEVRISLPDLKARFDPINAAPRSEAMTNETEVVLPTSLNVHDGVGYVDFACHYQVTGRPALESGRLKVRVRVVYQASMDDLEDMLDV